MNNKEWIPANWQLPNKIQAGTTTRTGGMSIAPYTGNNLGFHVGDNPNDVLNNRKSTQEKLSLPSEPEWLEQTHSTKVVIVEKETDRNADAAITRASKRVLSIMTADCLPILLSNEEGSEIAAIHAGWRGLAYGILENTLLKMESEHKALHAWIGPGICGNCYATGEEVYSTFKERYPFAEKAFRKEKNQWFLDLAFLANCILNEHDLASVSLSQCCTYENREQLYSYRAQNITGRMATFIWIP